MKKNIIRYGINLLLIISLSIIAVTALIIFPGLLSSIGIYKGTLPIIEIRTIHHRLGLFFGFVGILHLLSYSKMIVHSLKQYYQRRKIQEKKAQLKKKSRASLKDTKKRYARLRLAMSKAEKSMDPVLRGLNDYVLYLKHNLNAKAVGALRKEVDDIEIEVKRLVQDMAQSVHEADRFLKSLD